VEKAPSNTESQLLLGDYFENVRSVFTLSDKFVASPNASNTSELTEQALFPICGRTITEETMLASGKMIGFIPTTDYEKARAFYEGNLGFHFITLDQFALVMSVGGHEIWITKVPNFNPLQGTILGWRSRKYRSDRHLAHGQRRCHGKVSLRSRS
jgi:hypothetical protein